MYRNKNQRTTQVREEKEATHQTQSWLTSKDTGGHRHRQSTNEHEDGRGRVSGESGGLVGGGVNSSRANPSWVVRLRFYTVASGSQWGP